MKKHYKISIAIVLFLALVVPLSIHAADIPIKIDNPVDCGITNNNNCTLITLITVILARVVTPVAAVVVVLWIIWAGFTFVMAQGKEKEITAAKQRLLWSLIGAGILLGATGIAKVVEATINALITN